MYLKIVGFLLYMKVKIFWWYIMPLFRDFYYFLARYLVWSTMILGGPVGWVVSKSSGGVLSLNFHLQGGWCLPSFRCGGEGAVLGHVC